MKSLTPLLLLILCLLCNMVFAQTDTCISNLKSAATEYDQANYDQAIVILNSTLKGCSLSRQEQIQANKLLILCYLGVDNLEAANSTAAAIMKIDPNFKPDKFKDDPRLSSLFDKFKPEPTLAVNIEGGLNIPQIEIKRTYSVVHADDATGLASYESQVGYQFSTSLEKRVYKNFWLEAQFEYRKTLYKHTLDSVQGNTIFYSENLSYFDIPVSLKFYFLRKVFTPYVQAGADFSFLSSALSTTTRTDQKDIVDRTALRNNFDVGYFGAAGVSYAIKGFRVFGNIRYIYFPDLINKDGTRYADNVNLYKYYYVDDDFRMDNLQFSVGASYILMYKIKKVK